MWPVSASRTPSDVIAPPPSDNDAVVLGECRSHDLLFYAAERLLTVYEQFGDAAARGLDDLGIRVQERQLDGLGEPAPDRGFSGAWHPHQHCFRCHQPDACTGCDGLIPRSCPPDGSRCDTARR